MTPFCDDSGISTIRAHPPAFVVVPSVGRGGLFIDELERKPNGGKFPFFGVGCRHSGGHFPADTLHRVPALETVLIATSVLPERAPSPLAPGRW